MAARIAQIEAQAAALQKELDHALSVITELQEAQKAVPPPPPPPPAPAPVAAAPTGPTEEESAASSSLFFNAGAPAGRAAAAPGHVLGRPGGDAGTPLSAEPSAGPSAGSSGGAFDPPPTQGSQLSPDPGSGALRYAALDAGSVATRIAPLLGRGRHDHSRQPDHRNQFRYPGTLVAQVRENVYDTLTGRHLLIPQGSKLVGVYGSDLIYGQERVRCAFTRLIRPDGASVNLAGAEAADTAGMAGLTDESTITGSS